MLRRRRALLGALLITIGVWAQLAAADTARRAALPPYLTPARLEINLNTHWRGASVVRGLRNAPPAFTSAADKGDWVWAAACGSAQQKAVFARRVEVNGEPADAELDWNATWEGPSGWRGLKTLELVVNGKVVSHWKDPQPRNNFHLTAAGRKAFVPGTNEIALRATRAALPPGTRCNHGGKPPFIAVSAKLLADFGADLVAPTGKGQPGRPDVEVLACSKECTFRVSVYFDNEGPSRAVDGEVNVFSSSKFAASLIVNNDFEVCETVSNTVKRCRFSHLDRVAKKSTTLTQARLKVDLTFTPPSQPGWDHEGAAVNWTVSSKTPDPEPGTNQGQNLFIFCEKGAQSKAPECANAK